MYCDWSHYHVGKGAVFLHSTKDLEELQNFGPIAGSQIAASANEGVSAPIHKPGITCDDSASAIGTPANEKGLGSQEQFPLPNIGERAGIFFQKITSLYLAALFKPGHFIVTDGLFFRIDDHVNRLIFQQGELKPSGAECISAVYLSAGGFKGVKNLVAPLGLRVIFAGGRIGFETAICSRSEDETGFTLQGVSIDFKMPTAFIVQMRFAVEASVFNIEPHGGADIGFRGEDTIFPASGN